MFVLSTTCWFISFLLTVEMCPPVVLLIQVVSISCRFPDQHEVRNFQSAIKKIRLKVEALNLKPLTQRGWEGPSAHLLLLLGRWFRHPPPQQHFVAPPGGSWGIPRMHPDPSAILIHLCKLLLMRHPSTCPTVTVCHTCFFSLFPLVVLWDIFSHIQSWFLDEGCVLCVQVPSIKIKELCQLW